MSEKRKYRRVVFYRDYFENFFRRQNHKIKAKIIWTLELIEDLERVPETYLKHLASTNGLYEIRVKHGKTIIRIFCFFDRDKLVILANDYQKKSRKILSEQIKRAKRIKKEYEDEKQHNHHP